MLWATAQASRSERSRVLWRNLPPPGLSGIIMRSGGCRVALLGRGVSGTRRRAGNERSPRPPLYIVQVLCSCGWASRECAVGVRRRDDGHGGGQGRTHALGLARMCVRLPACAMRLAGPSSLTLRLGRLASCGFSFSFFALCRACPACPWQPQRACARRSDVLRSYRVLIQKQTRYWSRTYRTA